MPHNAKRPACLLAAEGLHRVATAGGAGRDEARHQRERDGDAHEHRRRARGQVHDALHVEVGEDPGIHGDRHRHDHEDSEDTGDEALDEGLGVEDARDVAL